MNQQDQHYYTRRERQERDLAERSADPATRQLHLHMAAHYSALLQGIASLATPSRAA